MRRFAQAFATAESVPQGLPEVLVAALVDGDDRYNVAKGKQALVLAINAEGMLCVAPMTWGLIPRWSKGPATPYTTVTARLDRAPKSRLFAQAWKERPCVVPMTGYYKWDRHRKPPWPHFIQRQDGVALLAAGIWETWQGQDGTFLHSFALLTGPNTAIPPPLTQDGPVFLGVEQSLRWLRGSLSSPRSLVRHAQHPPLESYPVSRAISDASREGYTLLEPADPEDPKGDALMEDEFPDVDDGD